jgi:hypothetical protein
MGHPAFVAGEASWSSLSQLANASRPLGMTKVRFALSFIVVTWMEWSVRFALSTTSGS